MATYSDLASIRNSSQYIDRCTMSIASYAKYILGQTNVKARNYNWAQGAIISPGNILNQLSAAISLDPTFANLPDGTTSISSVTDEQIDNAVQTTINNTVLA